VCEILSSTAIYNNPFTAKGKASILKMYNVRPGNVHTEDLHFIIFDSGFKEGIYLFVRGVLVCIVLCV
jgi:hypothetical protein